MSLYHPNIHILTYTPTITPAEYLMIPQLHLRTYTYIPYTRLNYNLDHSAGVSRVVDIMLTLNHVENSTSLNKDNNINISLNKHSRSIFQSFTQYLEQVHVTSIIKVKATAATQLEPVFYLRSKVIISF